jgi:D-alanyl-D-alanine dipeptidase
MVKNLNLYQKENQMRLITISIVTLLFTACQSSPKISGEAIIIPKESQQLLKVVTKDWHTKEGVLWRYEREEDGAWHKVGKAVEVILGRNGLGWGLGLHTIPKDAKYIKKEGDGKAPAGLFALGHGFGYQDFKIDFAYTKYQRTDHCVDDANSKWYNQIVDSTKIEQDYKSFEHMRLKSNLYAYGITVEHNPNAIANAGSCIFMHIRNHTGKGTAGCTAMDQERLVEILKWLKEEKKPLLLQLPQSELTKKIYDNSLK